MKFLSIEKQDNDTSLVELDVSTEEYVLLIKLGHRLNKKEYDEHECFQIGVGYALERIIKENEK